MKFSITMKNRPVGGHIGVLFRSLSRSNSRLCLRTIHCRLKGHNKRPHRVDVTKLPPQSEGGDTNGPSPVKVARMAGVHDPHDPNSSDHVVAVTQLKEKIAHLQKQITIKDGQLLAKDRQVRRIFFPGSHNNIS